MKILSSLFCLMILNALISCSKKSDPPTQATKTDQITASVWLYDNAGLDTYRNGTIGAPFSVFAPGLVPACTTDNLLTFKRDNTGVTDEGATKCNSSNPQTSTFNWSFADNETNINISNSTTAVVNGKSKIVTLSSAALALSRDTIISGTSYSLIVMLKH